MKSVKKLKTKLICLLMVVAMVVLSLGIIPNMITIEAASLTPVQQHGRLSVSGTQLVDQSGKAFQLRGVSTHGLQWFGQYNNKAAYKTLRDDWGVNCIRLAMYTDENGYCSYNKDEMLRQVQAGVQYATELGMYVIIDWHILNDGNPNTYKKEAMEFFENMAKKYKNNTNVLYEICNEPNGCSWDEIKSYAEDVIKVIRTYDTNAIIIVGTPTWSQLGSAGHLYEPVDNPITSYKNLMYTFHFYASDPSHNQWLSEKIGTAINRGLPVFVSEFGLSEASGNGEVNLNLATTWLKRCDDYKVSYCVWSLCNKGETSALINSNCGKISDWSISDLTTAGNFIRDWYRSKMETQSPEVTQLDTPSVVGVTNITTGVKISWNAVSGAAKYRVFRKVSGGSWTKVGDTANLSLVDKKAESGVTYSYTVRCISVDGNSYTSAYDKAGKSIKYVAAPILASPTNTTTGVKISWNTVSGATRYRVYRKSADGSFAKVADTTSNSYTDKSVKSGTTYVYTVRCMNSEGTASESAYDKTGVTIKYIAAPVISSVSSTSTGVKISWGKVAGAEKYRVYRKIEGGSWETVKNTTSVSCVDTSAKKGTKYYYTVVCINSAGTEKVSAYDKSGKMIVYK